METLEANQMVGFTLTDGGRSAAGFSVRNDAGDCVCRAISILTRVPYKTVYRKLAAESQRRGGKRTARNGVRKPVYEAVMTDLGLVKVKLPQGPRPTFSEAWQRYGDCIVTTAKHVAAVVGGQLCDTGDCRTYEWLDEGGYYKTRERKAHSVWVRA